MGTLDLKGKKKKRKERLRQIPMGGILWLTYIIKGTQVLRAQSLLIQCAQICWVLYFSNIFCYFLVNWIQMKNMKFGNKQITSTMSTPGIIGLSGKCPGKKLSFIVTFLIATAEIPGLYSITLSTKRNGNLRYNQKQNCQYDCKVMREKEKKRKEKRKTATSSWVWLSWKCKV